MQSIGKRIGAFALVLMFMLTLLGNMPLTASAEETDYVYTDAYVLNYSADTAFAGYDYNQPYLYSTPFMVDHKILNYNGGVYYDGNNFPEIFNLINPSLIGNGGSGTYASIAAYCTDATTGIRENTYYRRINLEDSTYFRSGAAGKIRAIVVNSFPYLDVQTIQAKANSWLESNNLPAIEQLQSGEAILATQVSIWSKANPGQYSINSIYAGRKDLTTSDWSDYLAEIVHTDAIYQQETEYTAQNIQSLYDYLTNLESMSAKTDMVSESSFENVSYSDEEAADGTYTITVSADVKIGINTSATTPDALSLSASCGDQRQTISLGASGEYTFTFTGLAERVPVKLEINGYQNGGDVYLFDAVGAQGASQTLVGYDSSYLPVHGEVTVTPDRILNIFKSTSEKDGRIPLGNIVFDIYQVATLAQLESGAVKLSSEPTAAETEKYQTSDRLITTLTTDALGKASYNFTANGNPDGVYLIVERDNPATQGVVEPFYLIVPGTNEDGTGYDYTLDVNPKNVAEPEPEIEKNVTELDNNSDSFDVGEVHTWIIRADIPSGIGNARQYVISDTLDYRLDYVSGSPVVKLAARDGTEITLEEGTHYKLVEGTVTDGGYTVDCFNISLTSEGMSFVSRNRGSGDQKEEIRVYFQAIINEYAQMGTNIPNTAHLDYTNSSGLDYDDDSNEPEVHTAGVNLLKTDADNKPLAGATFKIARIATEEELEDDSIQKEVLYVGDQRIVVVFVDFHATVDLSGEKVSEITTGKDGRGVFYGLAYGEYYLVETKAPEGYNLLTQPIAVTLDATSHLTAESGVADEEGNVIDRTVHVVNTKFILPETGGMGTTVFTVAGIGIICAACLLLLTNRKKRT